MRSRLAILILCSSVWGFGQADIPPGTGAPAAAPASGVTAQRQAWTEHLRKSTVSLGTLETSGGKVSFRAIGTGVLVAHQLPSGMLVGIATARHVLDAPSESWRPRQLQVRFAAEQGRGLSEDVGYSINLLKADGTSIWMGIEGSDVAVIPVMQDFGIRLPTGLLTDAIGDQDFANADDLFEGESVLVFGFPTNSQVLMGPDVLVRAVTRGGVVAWTNPDSPLSNVFMLDANILPGNSGGPVFRVPTGVDKYGSFDVGGKAAFLGIVSSTLTDHEVVGAGGMGRVEPASIVEQILVAFK